MSIHSRWLMWAGALLLVMGAPHGSSAQLEHLPYDLKFNSGQNAQPIFEGWIKSPDGGFIMHFGYLNRNYVEDLHVPIGPDNNIAPGGPDRGQPTYFYTRVHRRQFSVPVPKDWGKKELVWTVTVRGKAERAVAWLQPEWEIDPVGGGRASAAAANNRRPTVAVDAVQPIALPNTLTLTATVTDDGLPKPGAARKPAVGQETPPIIQPRPGSPEAPVNLPQLGLNPRGQRIGSTPPRGLSVSYIVWRGPAGVTFEPRFSQPKDGKAVTTATFAKPGAYVLRARATDTLLTAEQDVTVTVNGPRPTQP